MQYAAHRTQIGDAMRKRAGYWLAGGCHALFVQRDHFRADITNSVFGSHMAVMIAGIQVALRAVTWCQAPSSSSWQSP